MPKGRKRKHPASNATPTDSQVNSMPATDPPAKKRKQIFDERFDTTNRSQAQVLGMSLIYLLIHATHTFSNLRAANEGMDF